MTDCNKARDSGLELLRMICMLLIVAYHMVGATEGWIEYPHFWTWNLVGYHVIGLWGQTAVLAFVMITGYFMISARTKPSKIIRLALEVWFYSIVIAALLVWSGKAEWDWSDVGLTLFPLLYREYWFVTDYIILLLLIPLLNKLLRSLSGKETVYALGVMVAVAYGCSALMEFEYFGSILFLILFYSLAAAIRLHPIPAFSRKGIWPVLLMLCIIYSVLLMRLMNGIYQGTAKPLLDFDEDPRILWYIGFSVATMAVISVLPIRRKIIVLAVVGTILLMLSFLAYMPYLGLGTRGPVENRWSPIIGLSAVSLFMTFKNAGLPYSRIVNWLAGGVLGVYLIHEHWAVKQVMWESIFPVDMLMDQWFLPKAVFVLVVLLLGMMLIDKVREALFSLIARARFVRNVADHLNSRFYSIFDGDSDSRRDDSDRMRPWGQSRRHQSSIVGATSVRNRRYISNSFPMNRYIRER